MIKQPVIWLSCHFHNELYLHPCVLWLIYVYVKPLSGVLTIFDHDRQWFNTLIPPSHESAAVTVDCISRLSETVRLILRYTTVDIHCRDRRYEWDCGISQDYQYGCLKLLSRQMHEDHQQCFASPEISLNSPVPTEFHLSTWQFSLVEHKNNLLVALTHVIIHSY